MSFYNAMNFFNDALMKVNDFEGKISHDEAEYRRYLCSGLIAMMKGFSELEKSMTQSEEEKK